MLHSYVPNISNIVNIVLVTFSPLAVDIIKCPSSSFFYLRHFNIDYFTLYWGSSVAEWLACWTQAQKGPGSNRSRDAVG